MTVDDDSNDKSFDRWTILTPLSKDRTGKEPLSKTKTLVEQNLNNGDIIFCRVEERCCVRSTNESLSSHETNTTTTSTTTNTTTINKNKNKSSQSIVIDLTIEDETINQPAATKKQKVETNLHSLTAGVGTGCSSLFVGPDNRIRLITGLGGMDQIQSV